jgi:ankyrin repeat protein
LNVFIPLGPDFVEVLLNASADPNIYAREEQPPLLKAVIAYLYLTPEERIKTVELLLRYGADVNAKIHDGETILNYAALFSPSYSPEMEQKLIDVLIGAGADINTANDWGHTSLMSWALSGRELTVQTLLNAGANIHAIDAYGVTPLASAVFNFRPDGLKIMLLLIKKGGNINIRDESGLTLLHYAAMLGDYAKTELLIKEGLDVNDDKPGVTPSHMATGLITVTAHKKEGSFEERVEEIFENFGIGNDFTKTIDFTKTMQALMKNGANPNIKSGAFSADIILRHPLLNPVANIKNFYWKTPLEFAQIIDNTEVVEYLGEALNQLEETADKR